eukprot:3435600-Rhodomonas_salina.2
MPRMLVSRYAVSGTELACGAATSQVAAESERQVAPRLACYARATHCPVLATHALRTARY